jgi:UTP--glucose-1-phosphate uridylyltransferase
VKSLTDEHLAFLRQYGFDEELFAGWRAQVKRKALSIENNKVQGTLQAPPPDAIRELPVPGTPERAELDRLGQAAIRNGEFGVVILNGGMATRFGGVVKGIVEVFDGRSFLALKLLDVQRAQETCGGRIPVFVMNSFATAAATAEHFAAHADFGFPPGQITHFNQFVSVRLEKNGQIFATKDGGISPYGPGHGDFAPAFRQSGCLARFLAGGGRYLFVGNVDNLGARVHPGILGLHIQQRAEATVEVAPKWPGDVGGSPYLLDGKLQLVEQIRYPDGFDPDIVDVFNTNTLHFNADALDRDFDLGWYYVEKTVDGRKAVQVERLIGEMTRHLKSNFVRVKRTGTRTRFLPIKTPEDLEAGRDEIREMFAR